MGIFWKELYKVYARRGFLLGGLFLFALNMALIGTDTGNSMVRPEVYREAYAHIGTLRGDGQADFIKSGYEAACGDGAVVEDTYFLFQELYEQLQQIENYPDYLKEIQERADHAGGISIFQRRDPFSVRNARATAKAFLPLEGNVLQFTNTKMFVEAVDFLATDFFLAVLIFYVVVILVVKEKEKGLFALVKPLAYGRFHFLCAKMGVLFVSVCFFSLLFWGGNFLAAACKYGAVDLGACLQSVGGYAGSALNVTVGQYWMLFLASKMFIYFGIGLLFFCFALGAQSMAQLYVRSVLVFAVSFGLYWGIDGNSPLQILKYLNLVNLVRVTPVYQYYFNLNVCSVPVYIVWGFVLFCALLCAGAFFFSLYIFKSRDSAITLKSRFVSKRSRRKRCGRGIWYFEAYKLLGIQKAFWIFLLFVCLQGVWLMQREPYIGMSERYYKNYMQTLGGEVTDRTRIQIEREEERFASFDRMRLEAEQQLAAGSISQQEYDAVQKLVEENTKGQDAFLRVQERFAYVNEQGRKTGERPWMVYETGYEKLTGNWYMGYGDDMKNAGMLLIAMIAAFSAFFAAEYSTGMIHLISCCRLGQKDTVKAKLRVAVPLYTAFFAVGYAPDFIAVCMQYGLPFANAKLSAIPALLGFPVDIRLWQYLVLLYIGRYFVFFCILLFIFWYSAVVKDIGTAFLVLSVVLALPAFLHLIGLCWMDYVSLNAFVSGNMLWNHLKGGGCALLFGCSAVCAGFLYTRLLRVYGVEP